MTEFERLVEEFFGFWWRENPTQATAAGVHVHDGALERQDEVSRAERAARYREYLHRFEDHAPRDVGEEVDRALVADRLRWELYELEEVRSFARNPLVYLDGPLTALFLMAVREYAPAQDRARRAAERLAALPRVFEEARANLTAAAPVLVVAAAEVARSGLALLERVLPLHLGVALEDDVAQFAEWELALRTGEAALVSFARWLEEELLPRAAGGHALGRAAFEAKLRYAHGLPYDCAELLVLGEALQRETERALAAVAAELGGGGWRDVVERLKADHPPADGLLDAYRRAVESARAFVEERELVTLPGGEELAVLPTPEYLRPLIPYAAYQAPAPHEVEQRGLFFVTPPPPGAEEEVLRDHSTYAIPVTALHEAYPGHHLQLVWANRAATEPRRVFGTPVFAEGWALYCEELMGEAGYYRDPRERLFQLKDLLWRACRVVVDIGLHTRGWTVDRAVEYLVREAGLERASAEVEVRRYCAEPTQPLSYAVGRREILALRERYRARAGASFRLRDFHDRLLAWGTIPPGLVARGLGLA